MLKNCFFLFALFLTALSSPNCTVLEHKVSRLDKTPTSEEVLCRNVPPSLIITTFYFAEKPYPQDLIVSDSNIPTVSNYSSLLNMRHVRRLYLKGQGIKKISPGAFRNMESLEELDLSYNKLVEIPDGAFTGLKNLALLDLTGNNISDYSETAFKELERLELVEISGNPVREISGSSFSGNVKVKGDDSPEQ